MNRPNSSIKLSLLKFFLLTIISFSIQQESEKKDLNDNIKIQKSLPDSLQYLSEAEDLLIENGNENIKSTPENYFNSSKRRNLSIKDDQSFWSQCAISGDTCTIGPGKYSVKFGSTNNWFPKSFSTKNQLNIPCSPEVFGFNFQWAKEKHQMEELSFGPNNMIMGINSNKELMVKYPDRSWQIVDTNFIKVAINPIGGEIWAIKSNNDILYRSSLNENWQNTNGVGVEITIANNGVVWVLTPWLALFYRVSFSQIWTFTGGYLEKISINRNTGLLFGITSEQIGYTKLQPSGNFIVDSSTTGRDFQEPLITDSNEMFAVTSKYEVYKKSGSNWIRFPGTFKKMFSDSNGKLYGITPDNEVFSYNPKEELVCQYMQDPFKSLCRANDKSCITYTSKKRFEN